MFDQLNTHFVFLRSALKGYTRMVKNEEEGLGPVNRQRCTRPKRQKRRLGMLRAKGICYKRPVGSAVDSGKTCSCITFHHEVCYQGYQYQSGDSYNCLSAEQAASAL